MQSLKRILIATVAFVLLLLAIGFLLRYLRTRSLNIFVAYRLVLAAIVVVAWLR